MNSSSDFAAAQPPSYLPLEYHEAGASLPSEDAPEESPDPTPPPEPVPDPAEVMAARIEQERRAITAQVRQEAEREIQHARAAIHATIEQFNQQRDEYFREVEDEVVQLGLAIAHRLIRRELQIDPRLLAGLVRYELEQLEAATSVRLFVSPDSLGAWSEVLGSMPRPVELSGDKALTASEARIETALGSTTVSFERELKEIERGFFDLLGHRPAANDATAARLQ